MVAQLLSLQAVQDQHRSQYRSALERHEEALSLYGAVGDRRRHAVAMANVAATKRALQEHAQAEALELQALAEMRACGDRRMVAHHLLNMASSDIDRGYVDRAEGLLEEGLRIARELGDRYSEGLVHAHLGNLYADRDDGAAASRENRRAIELLEPMGEVRTLGYVYANLGHVTIDGGRIEEGVILLRRGHDIFVRVGDGNGQAGCLTRLAAVARLVDGDLDGCGKLLDQAHELLARGADVGAVADWTFERGLLSLARGSDPAAEVEGLEDILRSVGDGPMSSMRERLEKLRRAAARWRAGGRLHRGAVPEDVPAPLAAVLGIDGSPPSP